MGVRKLVENEEKYELLFTEKLDNKLKHFGMDIKQDTRIINSIDIKTLTKEVMDFWTKYPYHPVHAVPIKVIEDMVLISDGHHLNMLFKEIGVLLPPKERKKTKEHNFKRILHQYHLPKIQRNVSNMVKLILNKEIDLCKELSKDLDIETRDEGVELEELEFVLSVMVGKVGILTIVWIAREILGNREFEKWVISVNKTFYIIALAQAAYYTREVELEKVMVKPQTQVFNSPKIELANTKKVNKRLTKQIQKETINYSNLQKENFELKRENKRLIAEKHEIYRMNEQDKLEHLKELEDMQTYYLNVIEQLTADLETDTNNDVEEENLEQCGFDLKGLKIAVLGGSRERHFRELIEKNNGEMFFVSEDDFNKIEGAVRKADVVFYLKEVVGHHFFREAYPLSKKHNVPFIYINTLGVSTFKRELEKLVV